MTLCHIQHKRNSWYIYIYIYIYIYMCVCVCVCVYKTVVVSKTSRERWTIETSYEGGSLKCSLIARHTYTYTLCVLSERILDLIDFLIIVSEETKDNQPSRRKHLYTNRKWVRDKFIVWPNEEECARSMRNYPTLAAVLSMLMQPLLYSNMKFTLGTSF